jgi:transposase-like protein
VYRNSAEKHYQKYLKDNNTEHYVPINKPYTQDRINEFIGYIVDDKMTIRAASKKVNVNKATGRKYYHQYLKDNNIDGPIQRYITEEQKSELIRYIVDDKMSIKAASKKAKISRSAGRVYYY